MENREIKFRAWDSANGHMYFDQFYIFQKTGLCHYFGDSIGAGSNPEFYDCGEEEPTLMQYTGLKDQYGKPIFEGDILEANPDFSYRFGDTGVVEFEPDYGAYIVNGEYSKNQHHEILDCDVADTCKVVGNRYQHPELLSPTAPQAKD